MIQKQKAKDLVEKFKPFVDYQSDDCFNEQEKMLINAKQCALIAVETVINFLQEVKQEIEKL